MGIDELFLEKCKEHDIQTAQELLKLGANIHFKEDEALCCAIKNSYEKMIRFLINNGANVQARHNAPLIFSIHSCSLDIIKMLIAFGADITSNNYNFFIFAAKFNRIDIVDFVLKKISPPQEIKFLALISAIQSDDFETVNYLLEHALPQTARFHEALIAAIIIENAAIINLLLSYNKDNIEVAINLLQEQVMILAQTHKPIKETQIIKNKKKILIILKKMKHFFEKNNKEIFLPLNFFDKEDNYKYNTLILELCDAGRNIEQIKAKTDLERSEIESLSKEIESSLLFFISKKYFAGYHIPIKKGQSQFVNDLIIHNQVIFQKNPSDESKKAKTTIAKINKLIKQHR